MNDQDKLILLKLTGGDDHAYQQLFNKYYRSLSAHAFYMLGDDMEAEDSVQNLFIEIWDKKPYSFIHLSLKSYLQKAIHNSCLNILEKRRVVQQKFDQYVYNLNMPYTVDMWEDAENEKSLKVILNKLPSRQYLAFNLVHMEDRRYKDAAVEMGISVNSLKTHLKLAVKCLRRELLAS